MSGLCRGIQVAASGVVCLPRLSISNLIVHVGGDGCSIESRMSEGCGLLNRQTKSGGDEGWNSED